MGEQPAFPVKHPGSDLWAPGLTKREHVSAMVLQGILAKTYKPDVKGFTSYCEALAIDSIAIADALIKALNGDDDDGRTAAIPSESTPGDRRKARADRAGG